MNDDQLDRLVAGTAPLTDDQVSALDLRDAEIELMEEIMATTTSEVRLAGEPRPPRFRITGFRVAAAAAAVIAVVAAGVAISGQDDAGSVDTGGTTPAGTTELPHLIPGPGDVPDGFELVTLAEYGQVADPGKSIFLGHLTEGLPVVDLAISWNSDGGPPFGQAEDPDLVPTTVRGHDGFSCSGEGCSKLGAGVQAAIEWMERPDKPFQLTSPSLTVDQLVAIADGLEITGHDAEPNTYPAFVIDLDEVNVGPLPDDLPVPLDELARSDYEGPDPMIFDPDGEGLLPDLPDFVELIYWLDSEASLSVLVEPGNEVDLAGRLARTGAEPIADVRGHPAWVATTEGGMAAPGQRLQQIFWQEAPGVIVSVSEYGDVIDDTVLRDVAEGLHEATDAEWADLVVEASPESQRRRAGADGGEAEAQGAAAESTEERPVTSDAPGTGFDWQGPEDSTAGG